MTTANNNTFTNNNNNNNKHNNSLNININTNTNSHSNLFKENHLNEDSIELIIPTPCPKNVKNKNTIKCYKIIKIIIHFILFYIILSILFRIICLLKTQIYTNLPIQNY